MITLNSSTGLLLLVTIYSIYCVEFCACNGTPLSYLQSLKRGRVNAKEIENMVQLIEDEYFGSKRYPLQDGLTKKLGEIARGSLPYHDHGTIYDGNMLQHKLTSMVGPLNHLQRLSNGVEVKSAHNCGTAGVKFLVDIMEQHFGGVKNLLNKQPTTSLTFKYLRQYAPEFYSRCLIKFDEYLEQMISLMKPDTEAKMNALVGSVGEPCPADQSEVDACLAGKAEELDFAKGIFDANKMLKGFEKYLTTKKINHGWLERGSAKLFAESLKDTCRDVRIWFSISFDPLNMAQFLVPKKAAEVKLSNRYRKLNEYSRICIPVENAYQQVLINVQANMVKNGIRNALRLN